MSFIVDRFDEEVQEVYDDLAEDEYYDDDGEEGEYFEDEEEADGADDQSAADDENDNVDDLASNELVIGVKKSQSQTRKSANASKTAAGSDSPSSDTASKKPIMKLTMSQEEIDALRELATKKKGKKRVVAEANLDAARFSMLDCTKEHIKMNFDTTQVSKVIRVAANPAHVKERFTLADEYYEGMHTASRKNDPNNDDARKWIDVHCEHPRLKFQEHNVTSSRDADLRNALRKTFMASTVLNGKVFMHGGEAQGKLHSDLMCWDPQERSLTIFDNTLVALSEPEAKKFDSYGVDLLTLLPAASHHGMVSIGENLLIFAGMGQDPSRKFKAPTTYSWRLTPHPHNEMQIFLVHKPTSEEHIEIGYPRKVPLWTGHNTKRVEIMQPEKDVLSSKVHLPRRIDFSVVAYNKDVYFFGGRRVEEGSAELYRLEFDAGGTWKYKVQCFTSQSHFNAGKPWPRARFGHAVSLVGTQMVMFGGRDKSTWFNDLWVLDLDNLLWREIEVSDGYSIAPSLCYHSMFIRNSTTLYVYGGLNKDGPCDMLMRCDWQNIEGKVWSLAKTSSRPIELVTEESQQSNATASNTTSTVSRSGQLPVYGHQCVIAGPSMYSLGGTTEGSLVGNILELRDALGDEGRPHLLGSYLKQKRNDNFLTDVIFRIMHQKDGRPVDIAAHRCIVAARCPILGALITAELTKDPTNNMPVVEIYDCHSVVFSSFLDFLYCGQFEISTGQEDIKELVRVAQLWSPEAHGPVLEYICSGASLLNLQNPVRKVLNQFDQDLSKLVTDARGHHSDVTLYLAHADVHVPAHKIILCRAPFFKQMFGSGFKESVEEIVTLEQETSDDVLIELLRFLYTNTVNMSPANVVGLLLLSTQFQVQDLAQYCQIRLQSYLSIDNVIDVLQLSVFYLDGVVKSQCLRFIVENYDDVITSSAWLDLDQKIKAEVDEIYKRRRTQMEKIKAKRMQK